MRVFNKRKLYTAFLAVLFLFTSQVVVAYTVSCRAVIFSDATKVKRLYGKRVHERVVPASTVKVMTALLALEHLSLDEYVTVSQNATYPQPSKIYVKAGERYKVRDLLYAVLLGSANDAAVVLAEAVAGTHWKFAQMMTQRAKQLGAKHTRFANAHGLPTKKKDPQYTTAYDMYLIFRQAMRHEFFREAIKLKNRTITSSHGRRIALRSHNKILFKGWKKNIYGKTGYTRSAGPCFVGTTQKGDSTLIIAVFNCKDRWNDIKYIISHYGGISL
ncbi:MAG TPA: serine hydrolase [Candidatus Omnitrophota bacterium]|nr:serine hydrolase [Candidatus Omnitrophota bacterium]